MNYTQKSTTCLTCGGLIMEPNQSYGYSGPVCHCIVPPKIQRRADQVTLNPFEGIFTNTSTEVKYAQALLLLNQISNAWTDHQKTKAKSDGSHFQVDILLNSLMIEVDNLLEEK